MKKFFALALALSILPTFASAATVFEVSGWIPYWRTAMGVADTLPNLDKLTEINPFGYTVKKNGGLVDSAKLSSEPWLSFLALAKAKGVRVVPTVMWSDPDAMLKVLKNPIARGAHITEIISRVQTYGFDGIDIDYEGKYAEIRPYFSAFLKELYTRMGKKFVMCTIEARTPLADRYDTIPPVVPEYANDFVAINKYCDRVRFMTYDQGRIDLKLNAVSGDPYNPIADPRWIEKAIKEAEKSIPARKILLGIPTYGYEWELSPVPNSTSTNYDLKWSFNYKYATDTAESLNITPVRSSAGELSFTYVPTTTPLIGGPGSYRVMTWSDAQSIADRINQAKRLGLRGVSIFKFDGGEDQRMWQVLTGVKK